MKNILKYFALGALLVSAAGCSDKFDYHYQSDDNNVYWDYEADRNKLTSLNYNFFDDLTASEYLFKIPVRISGPRVDYARTFRVAAQSAPAASALPDNTAYAEAGKHYTMPATGTIAAGKGVGYVELTLLNTDPAMSEKYFQLKLNLVPSDDFDVSFGGDTAKDETGLNTVTVTFSQLLTMPDWWNPAVPQNWVGTIGTWTNIGNELFRIFTGYKDIGLAISGQYQVPLAICNFYVSSMKDPWTWVGNNAEKGYEIVENGIDGQGNPKYLFRLSAGGGREYEFHRDASKAGHEVGWMDKEGNFSIRL